MRHTEKAAIFGAFFVCLYGSSLHMLLIRKYSDVNFK